jgi:hypothetical protein
MTDGNDALSPTHSSTELKQSNQEGSIGILRKRTFTQRCSHWSKGQQFELQKAIANAFPGATGLRNKAYREFRGTILELKRRAAVA